MSLNSLTGRERIVVVGGANVDIIGRPEVTLLSRDSNPSTITTSPGGVGRNIAENLVRLGVQVSLVTAFGSDCMGEMLAHECSDMGIDLGPSLFAEELPGSRYVAILDREGDMTVAVNDMRVLELLTPAELEQRQVFFESADLVVVDANLAPDSLAWLAAHVSVPLLFDPVSAAKISRAMPILQSLAVFKCNLLEAATALECDPADVADAAWAARRLHKSGARCAIVTAGVAGAFWADETGEGHTPSFGAPVVNATGAGDAFTAGIAYALLGGARTGDAVRFASAVAALTLGAQETVNPSLSRAAVDAMLEVGVS